MQTKTKKTPSKGVRKNWAALKSVKSVQLTDDLLKATTQRNLVFTNSGKSGGKVVFP
jgi:hypothetical protein